jgi:hypothetical protein
MVVEILLKVALNTIKQTMKNEIKNTLNIYDINVDRFINICAMVA